MSRPSLKPNFLRDGSAVIPKLPGDKAAIPVRVATDDDLQFVSVVKHRDKAIRIVTQGKELR